MSSLFSNRGDITINSTATTNNQIQTLEQIGDSKQLSLTTFTNNHCGPFVIFLANALAKNQLTIGRQENSTNLTILQNGNPIRNLNKEQSDQLGRTIRQQLLIITHYKNKIY